MTPEQIQQKIFFGYAKAAYKLGATFNLYRSSTPINPISSGNLIGEVQMSRSVNWEYNSANKYGNLAFNACLDAQASSSPLNCRVGDYLVPTTASNLQYTASSIAVSSGGSGYKVGDLIIINELAYTQYISLTITSVSSGGVVTGISFTSGTIYNSPLPSNPVPQYYTSGAGVNATFNITWSALNVTDDNNTYYVQSLQFDLPPRVVQCNRTISVIRPAQTTGAGNVGYVGYQPSTSTTIMTAMPAGVIIESHGKEAATNLPTDTREDGLMVLIPNLGNVTVRIDDIIIDDLQQNYVVYANELTELGWRIRAYQVVNA
ncbi:MAG TPA: hypothetical protein VGW78_07790 [Candidatus Babeliales bacterium]|jgi:hypothetical protein|nr:hypothetical protein [Candidatus Babeliales bacterium]